MKCPDCIHYSVCYITDEDVEKEVEESGCDDFKDKSRFIEISEKELAAIMAASFCLRKSREAKNGGTYVSNVHEIENCIRIPFYEAIGILDEFIEKALKEIEK